MAFIPKHGRRLTDEEARLYAVEPQAAGRSNPKNATKSLLDRVLSKSAGITDAVFGGGKIGEAVGAGAAKLGLTGLSREERENVSFPSAKEVTGSAAESALLFTPVGRVAGTAAKVAGKMGLKKAAPTIGRVAAGAGTGFALDVADRAANDEEDIFTPGAGTAVGAGLPVAGAAVRSLTRLTGNVAKNVAAGLSGKGTRVIDAIVENPRAAMEGLRGMVTLQGTAANVRKAVSDLSRQASKEFGEDLDSLPKLLGRPPAQAGGKASVRVDGKTTELTLLGVKSKLTTALRDFGVKVNPRTKSFDFSEAPLDTAETKRLQEVFDVIDGWTNKSPQGFHKLARKISNFRRPGEQSQELNAIIDSVSRNVRNYIGDRIPAAKEMLKKYHAAQDIIEALDQEFATDGSRVGGTAERIKTERRISNIFSGEKESAMGLLESNVPGGRNLIAEEAGRELREGITRSSASIGDLLRSAVQTVITPKLVGEVTARTALTAQQAAALLEALQGVEEAIRPAVIDVISSVFRSEPQ